MDETFAWQPPESLGPLDLIIMPAGIFEHHPLTGQRRIAENHPLLKREATFAQTLDVLRRMRTVHHLSRAVFIHLGEPDGLTRAEYTTVADAHAADPSLPPLQFAFDSLVIDV
jgi:phosphoribosyl 1,2-cyclic phosphate phosphodiesterase